MLTGWWARRGQARWAGQAGRHMQGRTPAILCGRHAITTPLQQLPTNAQVTTTQCLLLLLPAACSRPLVHSSTVCPGGRQLAEQHQTAAPARLRGSAPVTALVTVCVHDGARGCGWAQPPRKPAPSPPLHPPPPPSAGEPLLNPGPPRLGLSWSWLERAILFCGGAAQLRTVVQPGSVAPSQGTGCRGLDEGQAWKDGMEGMEMQLHATATGLNAPQMGNADD